MLVTTFENDVRTNARRAPRLSSSSAPVPRVSLSNAPRRSSLLFREVFPQLSMKVIHRRLDGWRVPPRAVSRRR